MKGMIFAGCSFTWGQGLYYYSDLENQILMTDEQFNQSDITDAQIYFKNTIYFPRLVAKHYNTFEIVKKQNGGSENQSYIFLENLFTNPNNFLYSNFEYDDFEYIIFQTSQIVRNAFEFEYNGKNYKINPPKHGIWISDDEIAFMNWLTDNGYTYKDWYKEYCQQVFEKLKNCVIFYESKGIKVRILSWQDDILPYIKNDEYMNDRFITLEYENTVYDCIAHMTKSYPELLIENDPECKIKIADKHPSKKCHRIIADSIIKKINQNEPTTIHAI